MELDCIAALEINQTSKHFEIIQLNYDVLDAMLCSTHLVDIEVHWWYISVVKDLFSHQ